MTNFRNPKALLAHTLLYLSSLVSCSGPDPPLPFPNPESKDLTKQLLSLDLGFNVLNDQLLRESIGVGFHIAKPEENQRSDEFDDFFISDNSDDDLFGEFLPDASPLVSKDDFSSGPSPSSWNSHERFFFTRPSVRRRRPPPRDKFFVGDQSQCLTGSCEFFGFCWLQGGVIEGGCGGFLMACCNKPNQVGHKTIVTQVGPKFETLIWTGDLKIINKFKFVRIVKFSTCYPASSTIFHVEKCMIPLVFFCGQQIQSKFKFLES